MYKYIPTKIYMPKYRNAFKFNRKSLLLFRGKNKIQ